MFVCPAGHMAIRKAKQGKTDGKWNQTWTYYFDVEKCKVCSWRKGCYKMGQRARLIVFPLRQANKKPSWNTNRQKDFKTKARKRYKIEAKNSELKHVYGYERAQSYGLYCMQMQGALAIFASNIKRILKLI